MTNLTLQVRYSLTGLKYRLFTHADVSMHLSTANPCASTAIMESMSQSSTCHSSSLASFLKQKVRRSCSTVRSLPSFRPRQINDSLEQICESGSHVFLPLQQCVGLAMPRLSSGTWFTARRGPMQIDAIDYVCQQAADDSAAQISGVDSHRQLLIG